MRKLYSLILATLLLCSPALADEYYLGQWTWDTSEAVHKWTAPHLEKSTGSLDLRSLPDQATPGPSPQGYAIFTYSEKINDPDLIYLGDNKDFNVPKKAVDILKAKFGDIKSQKIKDIIYEILTEKADPSGLTAPKPLMPDKSLKMKIKIGDEGTIKETSLIPGLSKEWDLVLATIQNDYKQLVIEESQEKIARMLDALEEQYGVSYLTFIPQGYTQIASLPHQTTITESFNTGDSTTLGPDLTWTEVVGDFQVLSNKMAQVFTSGSLKDARADSDLSSADHYTQITLDNLQAATKSSQVAVLTRFSASAETYYLGSYNGFSQPLHRLRIEKMVAGTVTGLVGPDTTATASLPATIKLTVSGSNLELFVGGVSYLTTTDTAITGNLRTGIGMQQDDATPLVNGDNFEAADLSAPPPAVPGKSIIIL